MNIFFLSFISVAILASCGTAQNAELNSLVSDSLVTREAHPDLVLPTMIRGMSPFKARKIRRLRRKISEKENRRRVLRRQVFRLQGRFNVAEDRFRQAQRRLRGFEICISNKALFKKRCNRHGEFYRNNKARCANPNRCGSRVKIEGVFDKRLSKRNIVAERLRNATKWLREIHAEIQDLEQRLQNLLGAGRGIRPSAESRRMV